MPVSPPAEIGMALAEVDTPALIIDLDVFEANMERMAKAVRAMGVVFRPHAKTHKSADIARAQMSHGAVGVCCQKVTEAEALVDAGITDILVTNEVVGQKKIERLVQLAKRAVLGVCVDNSGNVDSLNDCAAAHDVRLNTLVEINVGSGRCGVSPGPAAVALAKQVAASSHLSFGGLQAYHGRAQHIRKFEERRLAIESAASQVRETTTQLAAEDIVCARVTGAGTGTWQFEGTSGIYTELQAGSYLFMDADYGQNEDGDDEWSHGFGHSLFVYSTVMSLPDPARVVVDAGLKSMAFDSGMPVVVDDPSTEYGRPSDEHGNLQLSASSKRYTLGDKVRLIPGHCDPTVNLHDWYVGVRAQEVEALWPVTARGALF